MDLCALVVRRCSFMERRAHGSHEASTMDRDSEMEVFVMILKQSKVDLVRAQVE